MDETCIREIKTRKKDTVWLNGRIDVSEILAAQTSLVRKDEDLYFSLEI